MATADSARLSVTLPREQAEQLTRWAQETGTTKSEIVRRALSLYEPGAELVPEFLGALSDEMRRAAASTTGVEDIEARLAEERAADAQIHARLREWMQAHPGEALTLDVIRELASRA